MKRLALAVLLVAGSAQAARHKVLLAVDPAMQSTLAAAVTSAGYDVVPGGPADSAAAVLDAMHKTQVDAAVWSVCAVGQSSRIRATSRFGAEAVCQTQVLEPVHGEALKLPAGRRGGAGDSAEAAVKAVLAAQAAYLAPYLAPELGRVTPGAPPAPAAASDAIVLTVVGARSFKDLDTVATALWLANGKKGVELARLVMGEARFYLRGKTPTAIGQVLTTANLGDLKAQVTAISEADVRITLRGP